MHLLIVTVSEIFTIIINSILVVITGVYAFLTSRILRSSKELINKTIKIEAPILIFDVERIVATTGITGNDNRHLLVDGKIKNLGKTAALGVYIKGYIDYDDDAYNDFAELRHVGFVLKDDDSLMKSTRLNFSKSALKSLVKHIISNYVIIKEKFVVLPKSKRPKITYSIYYHTLSNEYYITNYTQEISGIYFKIKSEKLDEYIESRGRVLVKKNPNTGEEDLWTILYTVDEANTDDILMVRPSIDYNSKLNTESITREIYDNAVLTFMQFNEIVK